MSNDPLASVPLMASAGGDPFHVVKDELVVKLRSIEGRVATFTTLLYGSGTTHGNPRFREAKKAVAREVRAAERIQAAATRERFKRGFEERKELAYSAAAAEWGQRREERREAVGVALKAMGSDYPTDHAIAARAASDGQWDTAARFYRRASELSPNDPSLRANVAFAEVRAAD